jgi:hypothetical protein
MEQPKTSLKRGAPVAALAIVAVAVLGAVLFVVRSSRDPAAPPQAGSDPAAAPTAAAGGPPPPAGAAGEPGEAADPGALLAAVSPHPLFRAAIEGEYLRRWAVVVDNLAEGASPRRRLAFLAPARPFTVTEGGGATVIDPESYRRYDAFADAVASLDAAALSRAYRALRGPLEAVYRGLGYPEASIDRVVARALQRIESAPVEEGPVPVEQDGAVFVFRERRLEDLPEVEKHLLRVGPRNARLVQGKAREIRRALGLPAPRDAAAPTPRSDPAPARAPGRR